MSPLTFIHLTSIRLIHPSDVQPSDVQPSDVQPVDVHAFHGIIAPSRVMPLCDERWIPSRPSFNGKMQSNVRPILDACCLTGCPHDPLSGNFQSASHAIGGKYQIHGTAEFEGNEFANNGCSIARSLRGCNKGATDLLPIDGQAAARSIPQPPPPEQDAPAARGEPSVLCRVRCQLIKDHRQSLRRFCFQRYARTTDARFTSGVWRKLALYNFRERYAAPAALAQQFMGVRQGLYPLTKTSDKVRVRAGGFLCLLDDGTNRREHVLDAMVELSVQEALMFLSSFARSYVACDF